MKQDDDTIAALINLTNLMLRKYITILAIEFTDNYFRQIVQKA